jgi:hypothetical protein
VTSEHSARQVSELVRPFQAQLERALNGFPPDKISEFALWCFGLIGEHQILDSDFDEANRQEALDNLRRSVAATRRLLGRDSSRWVRFSPRPPPVTVTGRARDLSEVLFAPFIETNPDARYWNALRQFHAAAEALDHELRGIEETPARKRGRPRADARMMLSVIARRYFEIFGERPTTTPGGRFSNVAVIVLAELRDVAPEDVSRHVRAAVRSL